MSVVCLCYNHKRFVEESIASVLNQSYENIEIIVVDDASTDGSKEVIRRIISQHPEIQFVDIAENVGNCKAFNKGFALCKGEFIIDLAADDLFTPNRLALGVNVLGKYGEEYGVHYGDVQFIDEAGVKLDKNSDRLVARGLPVEGPEGDIYAKLLGKYFLSSPSMMSRREVFDHLGGYDESLSYEDLDFWIRSSRVFKYCYTHEVMALKRILPQSHSSRQYRMNSVQMQSTYKVCLKAFELNRNKEEDDALLSRINYEMKHCLSTLNFSLLMKYLALRKRIKRRKNFS